MGHWQLDRGTVRIEFSPGDGEVVQFFVSPTGVGSMAYHDYVFRR